MTEPARLNTAFTRPVIFPDCPTCTSGVSDVITEGGAEDRRFGSRQVYVVAGATQFELVPCGHHVRGYLLDPAKARVREWTTRP